jgi:hypothetical protein
MMQTKEETPSLVTSASLACFAADSKKAAFYDLFTIAAPKPKAEKRRLSQKEAIWLAQVDDFRTFLGDFVSNIPQVGLALELRL